MSLHQITVQFESDDVEVARELRDRTQQLIQAAVDSHLGIQHVQVVLSGVDSPRQEAVDANGWPELSCDDVFDLEPDLI